MLIIAYGNPLRSDDGVAWRVADALETGFSPTEVEILRLHQLTPELAERVSQADSVIFVDAAYAESGERPGEMRFEEVGREELGTPLESRFSHHLTPSMLVALAGQLYGRSTRAFSATLTGQDFDHGESLSAAVQQALSKFVDRIEGLVRELQSSVSRQISSEP